MLIDFSRLRKQAALQPPAKELLENELWDQMRATLERRGIESLIQAKADDVRAVAFWQAFIEVNRQYHDLLKSCLTTGEDAAMELAEKTAARR